MKTQLALACTFVSFACQASRAHLSSLLRFQGWTSVGWFRYRVIRNSNLDPHPGSRRTVRREPPIG
jgi:hypothetical protein